jgi:hypothetical protein
LVEQRVHVVLLKEHSTRAADPPQPELLNTFMYIVPLPDTPLMYTLPIAVVMEAAVELNTIERSTPAVTAGNAILVAVVVPSGAVALLTVIVGAVPPVVHPVPPIS